jgi:exodeoxyribonuclease III
VKRIKLACWNVNGLRSAAGKGFFDWLDREHPDCVCIQEVKIHADSLSPEMKDRPGYSGFFSCAERRGYSGVAIYAREAPVSVCHKMGIDKFDCEGRYLRLDFADFSLINLYCPNGKASEERLAYKLEFYEAFLKHAGQLRRQVRKLVVCGDFNTAHKAIDLARPAANAGVSGFLPEEREWLDRFVAAGFVDTFRHFDSRPASYTWWSFRTAARSRNVGWRIDYFFVSEDLKDNLAGSDIHSDVLGSDHCPVSLRLKF